MDMKQKNVLNLIKKAWPDLTELEKERLTGFGEGLAYKIEWVREREKAHKQDKGV